MLELGWASIRFHGRQNCLHAGQLLGYGVRLRSPIWMPEIEAFCRNRSYTRTSRVRVYFQAYGQVALGSVFATPTSP